MPKRAAIELLPEDARKKVNQLLIDSNFAGYDQLADEINLLLRERTHIRSVNGDAADHASLPEHRHHNVSPGATQFNQRDSVRITALAVHRCIP